MHVHTHSHTQPKRKGYGRVNKIIERRVSRNNIRTVQTAFLVSCTESLMISALQERRVPWEDLMSAQETLHCGKKRKYKKLRSNPYSITSSCVNLSKSLKFSVSFLISSDWNVVFIKSLIVQQKEKQRRIRHSYVSLFSKAVYYPPGRQGKHTSLCKNIGVLCDRWPFLVLLWDQIKTRDSGRGERCYLTSTELKNTLFSTCFDLWSQF